MPRGLLLARGPIRLIVSLMLVDLAYYSPVAIGPQWLRLSGGSD